MKMGPPTHIANPLDADLTTVDHTFGAAFSARLNMALDRAGIPKLNKGRQVAVKQKMRVSQEAVRKWLSGESIPRHSRLIQLSHWLDVSYGWLISGQQDEIAEPHQHYQSSHQAIPFYSLDFQTTVLNKIAAQQPAQLSIALTQKQAEPDVFLFSEWSDQDEGVFAFEINDNQMQPTFRQHDIVLINTQTTPCAGQAVLIAETRQLRVRRLKALHSRHITLITDTPSEQVIAELSQAADDFDKIRILGVVTRLLRTEHDQ